MNLSRREKKLFICEDNHKRECEGWTQRTFENSNIGQSGPASNIYNNWKCLYLDDAGFCDKPEDPPLIPPGACYDCFYKNVEIDKGGKTQSLYRKYLKHMGFDHSLMKKSSEFKKWVRCVFWRGGLVYMAEKEKNEA